MNRIQKQQLSADYQTLLRADLIGEDLKLSSRGSGFLLQLLQEKYHTELVDEAARILAAKEEEQLPF